jgi:hypothetical protein
MDGERIKEAFDDDDRAGTGFQHSKKVEEHERFAETRRQAILRLSLSMARPAYAISAPWPS